MLIYEKVTNKNSEKYFNDFLKKKDISLRWLFKFSNIEDKTIFNYSPKSLIKVWEIVIPNIKKINPAPDYDKYKDNLPLWFYIHKEYLYNEKDGGYTIESLQIMEALIYYFAEVFIINDKLNWQICEESKPKLEYTFLPILSLNNKGELYPFEQITTFALRAWKKNTKLSANNMYESYNHLKKYLK